MCEKKKCTRCHVNLPISHYTKKRNGDYQKNCNLCNDKNRERAQNNKCPHNKKKSRCQYCGGASLCVHNREKSKCKQCGGSEVCEHNNINSTCKECGGSQVCEHNKIKSKCKQCGGSQVCKHNKIKSICKECGGGSICEHNTRRSICKECNPQGHLRHLVARSVHHALHSKKSNHSIEYLGCDITTFRKHIEEQFTAGMTWKNYGKWQIDHIVPIKFNNPTLQQVIARLHYTNTQPLWKVDNLAKGNKYCGKKFNKRLHNMEIIISNCEKMIEEQK